MDPADAGHSVAGGSCYGLVLLGCRGIPGWSQEDSVLPQPLPAVHGGRLRRRRRRILFVNRN